MYPIGNFITFRFFFVSISILFVLHIFNDLDINSQYFVNVNALEIGDDNNVKEKTDLNYIFDSSEYFEEDNVPQNNNINSIINNYNNNRNNNNNNQLISQQQLEEQQVGQQQGQVYNQIKNKKYEFTSIESKNNENNNDDDIKSEDDHIPFNTKINLQNIEREGFLRIVGYINGQSFNEDIQLSELDPEKNKLNIQFNVLKDTEIISLGTSDEFFVCVYHIKDIENEYNSILYFDCNEAGVQDSNGKNTINVLKPSSMVYSKSKAFYDERKLQQQEIQQLQGQDSTVNRPINENSENNNDDDKILLKIIAPLSDRKDTKELKIAAMVRGQIQTETIKEVQKELDKSKDDTITRTFTFDRNTDIGQIQLGDRFHACVSSDDLNPPEGTECEKRLVKKFNSPNPLPAR